MPGGEKDFPVRIIRKRRAYNLANKTHWEELERAVARTVSNSAEGRSVMKACAETVAAEVKRLASHHAHTGAYARGVKVRVARTQQGVHDYNVVVDRNAVGPIEFGHKMRTKNGEKFVEGLRLMHKATQHVGVRHGR